MGEVTNSTEQKHYYAKYGNEEFSFSVCLYNNEGYAMFLQKNAVLHLEIDACQSLYFLLLFLEYSCQNL